MKRHDLRAGNRATPRRGLVGIALAMTAWHPLHTTITTIVYDQSAHRVTATVRVFEDDLGRAILLHSGAPVQAPTSDSASFGYIRATLTFAAPDGRPIPVEWCGSQTTGDLRWLCVQAVVPTAGGDKQSGLGGLRVRDAVLTEIYDDQVNVVMADYDGRHESLLFTKGDRGKALP
jgi:hypothetical protein